MSMRANLTKKQHQSFTPVSTGLLQRKCACGGSPSITGECTECNEKQGGRLQRSAISHQPKNVVPPIVHDVLRSSGQPLDASTRAFMEPRFGHDFSQVRVHTDPQAAESARAVNALAYTVGRDVIFGSGQYAPEMSAGRRLIAHELMHTVQQSSGSLEASRVTLTIGKSGDAHEREADALAARVTTGETIDASQAQGRPSVATLQRQATSADELSDGKADCTIGKGISNSTCSAYQDNSSWLPSAYVNNATCACIETPNVPTAKCVRKFLQKRMRATPGWLTLMATLQKPNDNPASPTYPIYQAFVQTFLTPRIYKDHVDAYAACCCPSGPAPYPSWIGVTSMPLPCPIVGAAIRYFGSCHGTPGTW